MSSARKSGGLLKKDPPVIGSGKWMPRLRPQDTFTPGTGPGPTPGFGEGPGGKSATEGFKGVDGNARRVQVDPGQRRQVDVTVSPQPTKSAGRAPSGRHRRRSRSPPETVTSLPRLRSPVPESESDKEKPALAFGDNGVGEPQGSEATGPADGASDARPNVVDCDTQGSPSRPTSETNAHQARPDKDPDTVELAPIEVKTEGTHPVPHQDRPQTRTGHAHPGRPREPVDPDQNRARNNRAPIQVKPEATESTPIKTEPEIGSARRSGRAGGHLSPSPVKTVRNQQHTSVSGPGLSRHAPFRNGVEPANARG